MPTTLISPMCCSKNTGKLAISAATALLVKTNMRLSLSLKKLLPVSLQIAQRIAVSPQHFLNLRALLHGQGSLRLRCSCRRIGGLPGGRCEFLDMEHSTEVKNNAGSYPNRRIRQASFVPRQASAVAAPDLQPRRQFSGFRSRLPRCRPANSKTR